MGKNSKGIITKNLEKSEGFLHGFLFFVAKHKSHFTITTITKN